MSFESQFDTLKEEIQYRIKRAGLDVYSLDNTINVLEELKKFVEEEEELEYFARYDLLRQINSEICVLRVRKHLKQLQLPI